MSDRKIHWNQTYGSKAETAVSWYQANMTKSLELIEGAAPDHDASIIDVGGGASTLPDSLLLKGYRDITVLDVSEAALALSKTRLGARAVEVTWITADVSRWTPPLSWDVWHDRAVFHFLTAPADQDAYLRALDAGTHSGSTVIISTFALDGPERCSGLPVQRYSPEALSRRIGAPYVLIEQYKESHITPGGTVQSFIYVVLKRK